MQATIGLLFCALLGITLKVQGLMALLWVPLGFAVGLFVSAQIILPLMLGLPRAIRLVSSHEMRSGVFACLLAPALIWLVLVFGSLFLIGFLWPAVAARVEANHALDLGCWLGIIAIVLSPLSRKSRSDFRVDFDRSYGPFYTGLHAADDSEIMKS